MGLAKPHISPNREMINMNKTTIVCKGRQQPSQEALDRFIETYKRMVKENEERRKSDDDTEKVPPK
mgnify:CR=1 FL=1